MSGPAEVRLHDDLQSGVDRLYRHRFPQEMLSARNQVWNVLCRSWFSHYIPVNASVIEIAAGYCEFINNISASERVAIDLNPETRLHAAGNVTVHEVAAEHVAQVVPLNHFDVAFMSNFLEHCISKDQVLSVLGGVRSVLKPGGRLLILGPNYRYCSREYFDFFDHHLALTEKSVAEALELAGFEITTIEPRTLPFTFRSRLPTWSWLVSLYLRLRPIWRIFGAQFFIVAQKN